MLARPPVMPSGPAIPSDTLVALGSLGCSAAQVVCLPQAGAISDLYCWPPGPCLLGSDRSLVTWLGLPILVTTISEKNWDVCVCFYVCLKVCVSLCVGVCVYVRLPCFNYFQGSSTFTTINFCSCPSNVFSLVILT